MVTRLKFGIVAVVLFSLCILGVVSADNSPAGNGLELSFSNWHGWAGMPIFCKPIKISDGVPSTAGVNLLTDEKVLNGKFFLIVKDSENEILWFVVAATLVPNLTTGPVTRELGPISNTSIDLFTGSIANTAPTSGRKTLSELLGGKSGNGKIDGPVSLVGIVVVMREPSPNTRVKVLDIQFDGKSVETFADNKNGWYIPEYKEYQEDYKKFTPGFKVSIAGQVEAAQ